MKKNINKKIRIYLWSLGIFFFSWVLEPWQYHGWQNPNHGDISDTWEWWGHSIQFLRLKKTKNSKWLAFGNLDINAINNKLEQLKYVIKI